jgi:DNA-binding MarR family transcriptional regulator
MKKITTIGLLLKKIYRHYSSDLLKSLHARGFIDLRASFLEILSYICENDAPSIKEVGAACGLKKQTMTSHLNELEKRGYISRKTGVNDRRELKVHLTAYGEKFKIALIEVMNEMETQYLKSIGEVELDRIIHTLENFHQKIQKNDDGQTILI